MTYDSVAGFGQIGDFPTRHIVVVNKGQRRTLCGESNGLGPVRQHARSICPICERFLTERVKSKKSYAERTTIPEAIRAAE